ncbi:MAG TPA: AAA family ATPase [Cytophagaceae bacterium]|jgi:HTH-type transcriptional repressor of NAD biosynthesis genes|nr:AAA family ATPase [Cytophagaceae bacterium]
MIKAFVFGKFLPFHKGHEAMINFALSKCDFLSVLICSSDKEEISGLIRKSWIEHSFLNTGNIDFEIFDYKENELPNTSVSSSEVSKIWASKFTSLFPGHSLLITSEPYGDYVANFMNIKHIVFDIERKIVPISASKIRADLSLNWPYLSNKTKAFYIKKVVLLGSESTGKTTLTTKLAKHFQVSSVQEAARGIIKNSNAFSIEDLYTVATGHAQKIEKEIAGDNALLIIDTDVHITQSYAMHIFGKQLELPNEIYLTNKADLYLYLNNDVAFIQDGTRLSESERNLLDISHRNTLAKYGISFHEITGNWEDRFRKSIHLIERLLSNTD